jgi:hypothetical protein
MKTTLVLIPEVNAPDLDLVSIQQKNALERIDRHQLVFGKEIDEPERRRAFLRYLWGACECRRLLRRDFHPTRGFRRFCASGAILAFTPHA